MRDPVAETRHSSPSSVSLSSVCFRISSCIPPLSSSLISSSSFSLSSVKSDFSPSACTRRTFVSPNVPASLVRSSRCSSRTGFSSTSPHTISVLPVSDHFDSPFDSSSTIPDMDKFPSVHVPRSNMRCTYTRQSNGVSSSDPHEDDNGKKSEPPNGHSFEDMYSLSDHCVLNSSFHSAENPRRPTLSSRVTKKTRLYRCLLSAVFVVFSFLSPGEVEAIICRIDASDGLLAAATAAGSATAALDIYSLPLCRSPYLVNSAIPPRDSPHIGLYAGGVIDIDLELLPSPTYANNLPLDHPRFQQQLAFEEENEGSETSYNKTSSKTVVHSESSSQNYHNNNPSPRRVLSEESVGNLPPGFVDEDDDIHSSSFKPPVSSRLHPSSSPSPSSSFSSLPSFLEMIGSAACAFISPFKYFTPHLSSSFSSISPTVYYLASSLHPGKGDIFPQQSFSLFSDIYKEETNTSQTNEEEKSVGNRTIGDPKKERKEGRGEEESTAVTDVEDAGLQKEEDEREDKSQMKYIPQQQEEKEEGKGLANEEETVTGVQPSSLSLNSTSNVLPPRGDHSQARAGSSHGSKEEGDSPLFISPPAFVTNSGESVAHSLSRNEERDKTSLESSLSPASFPYSFSSSVPVIDDEKSPFAEEKSPRPSLVPVHEKGRQRELSALMTPQNSKHRETGVEWRGAYDRLGTVGGDDLVHEVNNTYILIMSHFQLLFLEQNEDWVPSFTAADGVVADSYLPAFKRLPFTSNRMRVRVRVPKRDRYAVMLLNSDGLDLRLKGSVSFTNPDGEQLSVEQIPLPNTLFALMILYLLTVASMLACMLVIRRRKWSPVHFLMLGNFLFSALAFGLDWRQAVYVQQHGMRSPILWLTSRVFQKIHDIIALMTFILIALGWKTLRSHLSRIEVQFVTGLCVISLYLGLFEIILGGFQGTRYILHALGYICVLVAINANLALLHSYIADATISPATGDLYHKFDGYKTYRWIFFLYLLKPVSLVFFKLTFLNPVYEQLLSWDEWVFVFVDNFMDYLIYVGLLYAFRPVGAMRVFRDFAPENASGTGAASSGTSAWPG
ncbi:lung seven transmembrane receptor [Cystoisospora suis]|uniref:Lung seven transmembrane receptor n=1 Tax=Cystoisospora suis TaxID=483139 RepID=A0A2C6LCY9_9APIC|nr:lung seven transmembrane receptor [Cystoisospora suis]